MKKIFSTLFNCTLFCALYAQNWTPMAAGYLPVDVVVFSISAVGDNVAWAVASPEYYQAPIPSSAYPIILRTADGGANWIQIPVEEAAGTISFQIVAVDAMTAWITTQDYGSGPGRALYKTTDGGVQWTKEYDSNNAGVALNRFSDGQHWLAHNRSGTARSENNGSSWQGGTISGYHSTEYQLLYAGTNMSCTAGDTLWNGTSEGRIIRFTNFGQSYSFLNTGLSDQSTIYSVAFEDHLNGLMFYTSSFNAMRLSRSTDGGNTWSMLPNAQQPASNKWNIAAVPGSGGHYVLSTSYSNANGRVAVTHDFGQHWSYDDLNTPINAVVFTSPSTGWIGGGRITSPLHPSLYKYVGSPLVGTSAPEGDLPGFYVTPNPSNDIIRFDFEQENPNEPILASLSDAAGRTVLYRQVFDKQLDISSLAPGLYFLKIETRNGRAVRKIVVQ
ncbi:MAG TPA: T9SS type A sorting domain-containing protein [Saprospiraceae bacterium]|nr:T9SS type A sorting domain-containing protein [Saprospiraceae bacterium]HPI07706.1 T9SS type A sorting domain-containing protein [Saprospiraceae bacterium]